MVFLSLLCVATSGCSSDYSPTSVDEHALNCKRQNIYLPSISKLIFKWPLLNFEVAIRVNPSYKLQKLSPNGVRFARNEVRPLLIGLRSTPKLIKDRALISPCFSSFSHMWECKNLLQTRQTCLGRGLSTSLHSSAPRGSKSTYWFLYINFKSKLLNFPTHQIFCYLCKVLLGQVCSDWSEF